MDDEEYMRLAIEKAAEGVRDGQAPFGACIERDGEVLALEHNNVWEETDITAHAEVTAIRKACTKIDGIDLTGATIYSTCEPCPMCFSAIHWAKIGKIVYGASIQDAKDAGFSELSLSNEDMVRKTGTEIDIVGGILKKECVLLFDEWKSHTDKRPY
ncbi:nucleoside deaminase [Candidatus Altiarchaeota archaeon]